jgi:pimeloyl-ACP methyl ester carboxylesterase
MIVFIASLLGFPEPMTSHPAETHRIIAANGLRFGVLEAGDGPLALCLHGFPDTAHTWRHLLPALADAGFHAVAPFMRGYAPTDVPADARYGYSALAADANALHDALGGDGDAVLIGHDWGAEAAYVAASASPERWRRVVTLAVPPLTMDGRLFSDYDQLKRLFYAFAFRSPLAERIATPEFLARLWADWSPGYDATEDLRAVEAALADPEHRRAAVAYYRADPEPGGTPPQPTLYLHGARDGCVRVELVGDAVEHMSPGSRMAIVEDAGHFLHLERPDEVNALIVEAVG